MNRKLLATFIFTLALLLSALEIFAIVTAKSQYDYARAQETADELAVELGLVSASINSGDKTLMNDSVQRLRATMISFSENEYIKYKQPDLLADLRQYNEQLKNNESEINELLELSAALSGVRSELQMTDTTELDSANFYQIQQSFQTLLDALEDINNESLENVKARLTSFSQKIITLSRSSAVCVSVCTKQNFENKQIQLAEIKEHYEEEFKTLGQEISAKYSPSELIAKLSNL